MTPYATVGSATIYLGSSIDCQIEHATDIVVTDPPYDEKTHKGRRTGDVFSANLTVREKARNASSGGITDYAPICHDKAKAAMQRFGARWVVATCADSHAYRWAQEDPGAGYQFVRVGIWVKDKYTPQLSGDRPAMGYETIAIWAKSGKKTWNGGGRSAVWHTPTLTKARYQGEKPLPLVESFIRDFSIGGIVTDPFMGSGTTLVAASRLGLRSVGYDISERACELAARRLEEEGKQVHAWTRQENMSQRMKRQGKLNLA